MDGQSRSRGNALKVESITAASCVKGDLRDSVDGDRHPASSLHLRLGRAMRRESLHVVGEPSRGRRVADCQRVMAASSIKTDTAEAIESNRRTGNCERI